MQFGLQPFCYHDLVMNTQNRPEFVRRLVQNGMGMVELHGTWCEPRFDGAGVTPQQARETLRDCTPFGLAFLRLPTWCSLPA